MDEMEANIHREVLSNCLMCLNAILKIKYNINGIKDVKIFDDITKLLFGSFG